MKRVFLYVYGDEYSAMSFYKNYNIQEFYEDMLKQNVRSTTVDTDDVYAEVEIRMFDDIDDNFISFIRRNIMDYDMSKDTDFFEVKPINL